MTESMGGIVDRSQEHLGHTDVAVIAARRRLIKMARDLEEGIEPVEALQPEILQRACGRHGLLLRTTFSVLWTSTPRQASARSNPQALPDVCVMISDAREWISPLEARPL